MFGRLIEHEHFGIVCEGLDDFDDEALLGIKRVHPVGDLHGCILVPYSQAFIGPAGQVRDRRTQTGGNAEIEVLRDRQVRHQRRLLTHDRKPERAGSLRIARCRDPVDGNGAGVRNERARCDRHQRRLAGSVLADKTMNLAGKNVERHSVERADPRKRFARTRDLENSLCALRHEPFVPVQLLKRAFSFAPGRNDDRSASGGAAGSHFGSIPASLSAYT